MNNTTKLSLITIFIFCLSQYLLKLSQSFFNSIFENAELNYCLSMSIWIIIPILSIKIIFRNLNPFTELGIDKNCLVGFGIAFLICLPMLIAASLFFNLSSNISYSGIIAYCLFASLGEEILFRGFLFGVLFKHAKWGLIAAEFIEAFLFGLQHIRQGNTTSEALGVFAVTFSGGLWFAWLYAEWNYNLWISIFIHFIMNTIWHIFSIAHNAMGGLAANITRFTTIAFSIYLTIKLARKLYNSRIERKNWLFNKEVRR